MRFGLDIMGGDFAPVETIKGAILAKTEQPDGIDIVLIGREEIILKELEHQLADQNDTGLTKDSFEIVNTEHVIDMGENPIRAIKEKVDSSIVKGIDLTLSKHVDAFGSSGNTGAVFVSSVHKVKNIENVSRPAIFAYLPKESGEFGILIDVGANADCKPENLVDFGILGSFYAKLILKIDEPKVGLLNIGEEESKGNQLTLATHKLLKNESRINFVGNIEGRDLFTDKADIVVCDGFTGNIVLKTAESITKNLQSKTNDKESFEKYNYENYGATPILGINAPIMIGHGISSARAIKNMILLSKNVIETDLIEKIKSAFN